MNSRRGDNWTIFESAHHSLLRLLLDTGSHFLIPCSTPPNLPSYFLPFCPSAVRSGSIFRSFLKFTNSSSPEFNLNSSVAFYIFSHFVFFISRTSTGFYITQTTFHGLVFLHHIPLSFFISLNILIYSFYSLYLQFLYPKSSWVRS